MKGYCFSLFFALSFMVGCNKAEVATTAQAIEEQAVVSDAAEEVTPQAEIRASANGQADDHPTPPLSTTTSPNKKIIRSGNIAVESKAIGKSKQAMDALLTHYGGYYEQETLSSAGTYRHYSLIARIPAAHLDRFLLAIEKGGDKLTERSLRSEDVSLRYFDSESRLQSKRAYLKRYQEMVGQAKSVKDLLEIQEQIRRLQEEVDSQESVMRSLKDQIAYSSLGIQLFEYQANLPIGSQSFWIQLEEAVADGWLFVGEVFLFVLRLWPFILLAGVAMFAWRSYKNRKK
ncbi:DUF4349 domain-containing protein [Sphingobacterium griseoflavum]|nr:DUF4349 domain-containing protein [Sphingobacterium griseoflavum]